VASSFYCTDSCVSFIVLYFSRRIFLGQISLVSLLLQDTSAQAIEFGATSFLYDAVYAYLLAVDSMVKVGLDYRNGMLIFKQVQEVRFAGRFCHH
jgi:hypothetical protein